MTEWLTADVVSKVLRAALPIVAVLAGVWILLRLAKSFVKHGEERQRRKGAEDREKRTQERVAALSRRLAKGLGLRRRWERLRDGREPRGE